jgi:hypothetical protein
MPESGTAYVRFYIQSSSGYLTGYGNAQQVHVNANSGATVTTTAVPFQPGNVVYASVDADSSNGTSWTGYQFQGDSGTKYWEGPDPKQYTVSAYYNNYTCLVIPGGGQSGFTPAPNGQVHPAIYNVQIPTITYQTETLRVPVMGWKEVPYTPPLPAKVRAKLIPPPAGWDANGNGL